MWVFDRNPFRKPPLAAAPALPRTDEEVRELLRLMPRYRVVLHNDDYNDRDYVVATLLRVVPSLTPEDATQIMLRADFFGAAEVIVCLKEQAEHYRERLEYAGLTSTIEPV
jgi:ATP-dependent Clp protease adaptor protein ClpS